MKAPIATFILLTLFFSCSNYSSKEQNNQLSEVEELIKNDVDSAYRLLNNMIYLQKQDQSNLSNYILLLTDINIKKERYLLSNDSLLDVALHFFKKHDNTLSEGKAFFNKGQIWAGLSNNEDALNYYHQALDRVRKVNDRTFLSNIYSKIADVYFDDFLFDEALKVLNLSYELDSLEGLKRDMVISLGNIGQAHLYLEDPDKAISYFRRAESLSDGLNDSIKLKGFIYNCFSVYYGVIGDNEKALEYIKRSIQNSREGDEMEHLYLTLGKAFIPLHQYDSARYYLNQSVTSDNIYTKTTSYYRLYELEEHLENYKDAVRFLAEFQTGFDSIATEKYKTETEKLAYKYNIEKAVYEVNAKNEIHILILIVIFSILFLSVAIFSILRDKKRKLQEKEKENEILNNQKEILKKEKEISSLQHKLNAANSNMSVYQEMETSIAQYEQLIDNKKEELFQLLKADTIAYCECFKKLPIYKRIVALSNQEKDKDAKILTYSEQENLDKEINKNFSRFISEIKHSYPSLTDGDVKLCCLSLLKLDTNSISLCFTVSGANTIKQRRFRIKQRMVDDSGNTLMYDFIFSAVKKG